MARVPETVLCDSVNPSVEQQQQQQQGSPSSIYEDMVKRVSNVFSEGVARIPRLHPTSADSDSHADDVSMDPTVPRQETIHCSNPAGEKQSKLYQNTVSGAPEFSQATSLVPVCDSSPATHTPFLQALNMAPVSTSGTDTLSGVRPVVTKTEIITVTANASTTTVMSTSTVARMKSGPTSFSIGDESKAGVSSVVFLVMMVFWIVVAYLNV